MPVGVHSFSDGGSLNVLLVQFLLAYHGDICFGEYVEADGTMPCKP